MRKLVSALLAFTLLLGTCSAATIQEITFEGGNAYVIGTAAKDTTLLFTVVKKGVTPTGITNIGLVDDVKSDANGGYHFGIEINDLPDGTDMSGWYTLTIADTTAATMDFYFATEKGRSTFVEAVKTAKTNNDLTAFQNAFAGVDSNILTSIGIDIATYPTIKDAIIASMFHNAETPVTTTSLYTDYSKALGFHLLNNGDEAGISKYNPVYDGKAFREITDETSVTFIKEVMRRNIPYANYTAVEKQYQKAYGLSAINLANSAKLEEVFSTYETLLGLTANSDYLYYKGATASVKAEIIADMVDALHQTPVYDETALLGVIQTAVNTNKPQTPPQTGGFSGGGGGGGGGGGFAVSNQPTQPQEPSVQPNLNTAVFSDLSKVQWAEEAITTLYKQGIVNGTGYGTFEPDRNVNREEFVKMLIMAIGAYDENAVCEFSDADKDAWYYPYIASAFQKGIVTGYADQSFGIGNSLSREEAATMLSRCAEGLKTVRDYQGFGDDTAIADWAKDHVVTLYKAGIINGSDGNFNPKNNITRAEAAQMLYGYLEGGV